jgi:hypothetical protein
MSPPSAADKFDVLPTERRREIRLTTEMAVTITPLDDGRGPMAATIVNASGNGVLLRAAQPVPPGAAVRIEGSDMLLLGEVCRCEPGDGEARVAVQIHHSLMGLMNLEKLNRNLMGEAGDRQPQPITETATVRPSRRSSFSRCGT